MSTAPRTVITTLTFQGVLLVDSCCDSDNRSRKPINVSVDAPPPPHPLPLPSPRPAFAQVKAFRFLGYSRGRPFRLTGRARRDARLRLMGENLTADSAAFGTPQENEGRSKLGTALFLSKRGARCRLGSLERRPHGGVAQGETRNYGTPNKIRIYIYIYVYIYMYIYVRSGV